MGGGEPGRLGETVRPDRSLTPSEGESKERLGESIEDFHAVQGSFNQTVRMAKPQSPIRGVLCFVRTGLP